MNEDPYSILGIERHASKEEIKRAFRKKALEYHPDIHQRSPESVKRRAAEHYEKVSRAYEVLSSPRGAHVHQPQGGSYSTWRPTSGYQHTSYYRNRKQQGNVSPGFFHIFKSSGSLAITAALTCLCIGGLYAFDPWIQDMWVQQNKGKLFDDMVEELQERRKKKKFEERQQHLLKEVLKKQHSLYKDLKACFETAALPVKRLHADTYVHECKNEC